MNDNYETVKAIANELDAIVKGDMYVCPECGEIMGSYCEYADAEGYPRYKCECGCDTDTEPEWATLYDHVLCTDPFDIEYRVSGTGEYRSVRVMVACGGPNIYIYRLRKRYSRIVLVDRTRVIRSERRRYRRHR